MENLSSPPWPGPILGNYRWNASEQGHLHGHRTIEFKSPSTGPVLLITT